MLGVAAAAALLRVPSLDLPLDRDEGEFASLAWLWSAGHGLPYRDWTEQKPPANLGVHALAQACFKDGVRGFRWLSLLWTTATALALAFFVLGALRREGVEAATALRAACLSGLLAALLLSGARTQALAANTEGFLLLPLLAALALWVHGSASPGRLLGVGVFVGVAGLFKQPALAAWPFLALARRGDSGSLRAGTWMGLGVLLPWLAAWVIFAVSGGGAAFIYNLWTYNFSYVAGPRDPQALPALLRWLLPEQGFFWLLAAAGWMSLRPGRLREALGVGLLTGLAVLLVSGRAYPHYFIALLPALAALAALGLVLPWPSAFAWLGAGRWLALAAGLGSAVACNLPAWRAVDGAARSEVLYGLRLFAEAPAAAARIAQLCPPSGRLFLWGDEAELFYLARRVPATRFLYGHPFTGAAPPWPGGEALMLQAIRDPAVRVAVLTRPLNRALPWQRMIQDELEAHFEPDYSQPHYVLARRIP
jgi:hypothetical protein